ncbi:MAG: FAD-dependent oxidoreductase, partial [Methanoregulaceae archaeon]|nr:FAD-dependent oxidoreductase [Methanoregulaceae archaeon]
MRETYDFLVIGGGPGGAIAARTAASAGYSVLLVEKRPAIGAPVRCAEGIGKEALAEFIRPDERWISAD